MLQGLTIRGIKVSRSEIFQSAFRALNYQCVVLGISGSAQHAIDDSPDGLSFELIAEDGRAVRCTLVAGAGLGPHDIGEASIQEKCGLTAIHARAKGGMYPLGVDFVSTLAACLSLQGAFAALIAMQPGAPPRRISASLVSSALFVMAPSVTVAHAEAKSGRQTDDIRPHAQLTSLDGIPFELESLRPEPWLAFWSALGVERRIAGRGWTDFLFRFARATAPLPDDLVRAAASRPLRELVELARATQISVCPLRSIGDRAADADARHMLQTGPWGFTEGADAPPHSRQHAAADPSQPLSRFLILESCRRIQGPFAGRILAALGAEVLRIQSSQGDPQQDLPPLINGQSARFRALNYGKSAMTVDFANARDRQALDERLRNADAFLHNMAAGKSAKYGFDFGNINRKSPGIVYVHAGAWGSNDRPDLTGTDYMVQAYSGIADRIGNTCSRPGGTMFTILDLLGGVVAAQAVLAGLLRRSLHGRGCNINTSLLDAATLLTSELLSDALAARDGPSSDQATQPTARVPVPVGSLGDNTDQLLKAISASGFDHRFTNSGGVFHLSPWVFDFNEVEKDLACGRY